MTFKGAHALSALGSSARDHATWRSQLPHLDRLVETAGNKVAAIRSERNRVDAVLVALGSLQALDEISGGGVPDANASVERASSDVATIGGDGNGGDAVLDAEGKLLLSIHHIPQANALVTTARSNITAVASEIERVDILVVAGEDVLDLARGNIPDLYRS